jgi:LmbE family N-acetylglucosaminyl deacetylase
VLESDIIPYHLSPPQGEKIVVLAPHPDDETLGCGGTIRLLRKSGKKVKIIFLTSGDQADPSNKLSHLLNTTLIEKFPQCSAPGVSHIPFPQSHLTEYAMMREKEAIKALKILGVADHEFLRFPDRKLDLYFESALGRLSDIIMAYAADTIYCPSMIELNPDHRTTAALAMEMQSQRARVGMAPVTLLFYEVSTPLRPNVLIDITPTRDSKRKAVREYKSQLRISDYLKYITALNEVRTLTVRESDAVEAFWLAESPLQAEDITGWLAYKTPVSKNPQSRS